MLVVARMGIGTRSVPSQEKERLQPAQASVLTIVTDTDVATGQMGADN